MKFYYHPLHVTLVHSHFCYAFFHSDVCRCIRFFFNFHLLFAVFGTSRKIYVLINCILLCLHIAFRPFSDLMKKDKMWREKMQYKNKNAPKWNDIKTTWYCIAWQPPIPDCMQSRYDVNTCNEITVSKPVEKIPLSIAYIFLNVHNVHTPDKIWFTFLSNWMTIKKNWKHFWPQFASLFRAPLAKKTTTP